MRLFDEDGRKAILINPALLEGISYDFIGAYSKRQHGTAATATTATAATNLAETVAKTATVAVANPQSRGKKA